MRRAGVMLLAVVASVLWAPVMSAQQVNANLKPTVERIQKQANGFKSDLDRALDNSALNGTVYEDHLNRCADLLEDASKDMAKDYVQNSSPHQTARFIGDLEDTLIAATGINRLMLRRELSSIEPEWRSLRGDLNAVASQFHRPELPNVTVTVITLAPATVLSRADVKNVMEQLETSTDRFKDKFRKAVRYSTANMTDRQREWNRWARQLESVSDDLLDDYKDRDYKDFQVELENTMAVSAMMNRIMVRSNLSPDAEVEWANVRRELNTLAGAFGYALMPSNLTPVFQTARS